MKLNITDHYLLTLLGIPAHLLKLKFWESSLDGYQINLIAVVIELTSQISPGNYASKQTTFKWLTATLVYFTRFFLHEFGANSKQRETN